MKLKYEDLSIRQKIDYKWMGYVEVDKKTYIKCPNCGDLSPATVYGHRELVECTRCLKMRIEIQSRERGIIKNEG